MTKLMLINSGPNFDDLIDEEILERFKDSPVFYGDIINAQLIKTIKELIITLNDNFPRNP